MEKRKVPRKFHHSYIALKPFKLHGKYKHYIKYEESMYAVPEKKKMMEW